MKKQKGTIISLTLVFGTIFLILLGGLLGFILTQLKISKQKIAWENSLNIAEAGINYYWHLLNHTPPNQNPDIQDGKNWCCKKGGIEYSAFSPQCQEGEFIVCGTCDGEPCYVHSYYDPETNTVVGEFVLKIKAKQICGRILGVSVTSVGRTKDYPKIERKIETKFAAISIAEYSYISNEGVWFGSRGRGYGKIHVNAGVRMEGIHNSLVTSAQSRWVCTPSFGCCGDEIDPVTGRVICDCDWNRSLGCHRVRGHSWCEWGCRRLEIPQRCTWEEINDQTICDGVAGSGGPQDLWKFPVPSFDFSTFTRDLTQMKQLAQAHGLYYPPARLINPLAQGYHLTFNPDGTFDLRIITSLISYYSFHREDGWRWIPEYITREYLPIDGVYGGYSLRFDNVSSPHDCGLIFIEDKVWLDGIVKGKKTLAVADLITPGVDPDVIFNHNLDYTTLDGSDSLAIIVEKDAMIPLRSPNELIIRGVLIAQKGRLVRRHYHCWWYPEWCLRDNFTFYGTRVLAKRPVTTWVDGPTVVSGYRRGEIYFDSRLAKDPPPLLPYISEKMEIISWQEIK